MLKRERGRTGGRAERRKAREVSTAGASAKPSACPPFRPSALLPVYAQFPIRPVSGRGSWLVDEDGNEWLDAYGGHAVAATGHSHPDVVRAIAAQAEALLFYSTAVPHPLRERLAERLAALCPEPLSRVFFCNSGAEANENALHLARKCDRPQNGRFAAGRVARPHRRRPSRAPTARATRRRRRGAESRSRARCRPTTWPRSRPRWTTSVAAVIMEPVQGLSGARDLSADFLRAARRVCDAQRRGPDLRRGAVRRGALWGVQRGRGGRRRPRRADVRQGSRLGTADRRGRRDAGRDRLDRHRRPRQHLRGRPGALRGGARHARRDRARRPDRERRSDRRPARPAAPAPSASGT